VELRGKAKGGGLWEEDGEGSGGRVERKKDNERPRSASAAPRKKATTEGGRSVRTVASLFPHRYGTIVFDYPTWLGMSRPLQLAVKTTPVRAGRRPRFLVSGTHEYNVVRLALERAGFEKMEEGSAGPWSVLWTLKTPESEMRSMNVFQKVNHFPGSWALGRKDRLAYGLERAMRRHGSTMDIAPRSFVLPGDRIRLRAEMEREPHSVWIVKPPASSCGRGIRLVSVAAQGKKALPAGDRALLVQRYVDRPYLIDGRKWDLRLYVVVTSFDPLRIHLFREGLVRFATNPYVLPPTGGRRGAQTSASVSVSVSASGSASGAGVGGAGTSARELLRDRFAHLTNYSVNKKAPNFEKNTAAEEDGTGSKWSLSALRARWRKDGVDDAKVMRAVRAVIIKTLLCVEGEIASLTGRCFGLRPVEEAIQGVGGPCFQLFGFDILLEHDLTPRVLEVNLGASLSSSSPMDRSIKTRLLTDLFHMVGMVPVDAVALERRKAAQRLERLYGRPLAAAAALATSLSATPTAPTAHTAPTGPPVPSVPPSATSVSTAKGPAADGEVSQSPPNSHWEDAVWRVVWEQVGRTRSVGSPIFSPHLPVGSSASGARTCRTSRELRRAKLSSLSALDVSVIQDAEDEATRRGHFERIFPTQPALASGAFRGLGDRERYNNVLLEMWLCRWRPQLRAFAESSGLLARVADALYPSSPASPSSLPANHLSAVPEALDDPDSAEPWAMTRTVACLLVAVARFRCSLAHEDEELEVAEADDDGADEDGAEDRGRGEGRDEEEEEDGAWAHGSIAAPVGLDEEGDGDGSDGGAGGEGGEGEVDEGEGEEEEEDGGRTEVVDRPVSSKSSRAAAAPATLSHRAIEVESAAAALRSARIASPLRKRSFAPRSTSPRAQLLTSASFHVDRLSAKPQPRSVAPRSAPQSPPPVTGSLHRSGSSGGATATRTSTIARRTQTLDVFLQGKGPATARK
jgi:tubulin polyglutamylase TTLL4